jgi:hypothetical protein
MEMHEKKYKALAHGGDKKAVDHASYMLKQYDEGDMYDEYK